MSSAAARSGTAAKGFVGARWWGKPRENRMWGYYQRTTLALV
jgi:hypothetical protein